MSKQRRTQTDPHQHSAPLASVFESGVLPVGFAEQPDRAPPWPVVAEYLARGEHRYWVEGWAARSPAFAEVLTALRNDHDERQAPALRRVR